MTKNIYSLMFCFLLKISNPEYGWGDILYLVHAILLSHAHSYTYCTHDMSNQATQVSVTDPPGEI